MSYEIPVCRDSGYDRYVLYGGCRRPEVGRRYPNIGDVFQRARLQEETVTKETFERVTTTRKLFASTLV